MEEDIEMTYSIVQKCPVPKKLAPILSKLLKESGATLQSCYRGADAEPLLHKYGKLSQRELYNGWIAKKPGFHPANKPGFSTHELRSDGVAFPSIPSGDKLFWWQVGLDIDDSHINAFIKAAKKRGYKVTITYPASISEHHHVNFRKQPRALSGTIRKLLSRS